MRGVCSALELLLNSIMFLTIEVCSKSAFHFITFYANGWQFMHRSCNSMPSILCM